MTRESFVSICWRLVPYFLNNWQVRLQAHVLNLTYPLNLLLNPREQKWGAECSSMMFELPHFAIELLIILPCVQVCLGLNEREPNGVLLTLTCAPYRFSVLASRSWQCP